MIEDIFSDMCYYEKLECDPYHRTNQEHSKLMNKYKNGHTEKEREYLEWLTEKLLWFTISSQVRNTKQQLSQ